jgi:hypothetical protein
LIVLTWILIGATLIAYFRLTDFRHLINMIIIHTLKIPLSLFEWIENKHTMIEPIARPVLRQTRPQVRPEPVDVTKQYKYNQSPDKLDTESILRNFDKLKTKGKGLPDFDELDVDSWATWIKNNPDMVNIKKSVHTD